MAMLSDLVQVRSGRWQGGLFMGVEEITLAFRGTLTEGGVAFQVMDQKRSKNGEGGYH